MGYEGVMIRVTYRGVVDGMEDRASWFDIA